ncbi:uncharacterized protein E0L32_012294, partial [Thyridium curvatum]
MLTTKPYLRIRRPSPTTAEFIVSTRPPLTIPLRLLLLLAFLLRLALAAAALLLLHAKWLQSPYYSASAAAATSSSSPPPIIPPPPPTPEQDSSSPSYPSVFSDAFIWHVVARAHASQPGRALARAAAALPAP